MQVSAVSAQNFTKRLNQNTMDNSPFELETDKINKKDPKKAIVTAGAIVAAAVLAGSIIKNKPISKDAFIKRGGQISEDLIQIKDKNGDLKLFSGVIKAKDEAGCLLSKIKKGKIVKSIHKLPSAVEEGKSAKIVDKFKKGVFEQSVKIDTAESFAAGYEEAISTFADKIFG